MKRLSEKVILSLISEIEEASSKGWEVWSQFYDSHTEEVELSFPSGELFNKQISGFMWIWAIQNRIKHRFDLIKSDRFSAQGLEGRSLVNVSLITALLAYRDLPRFRRQIRR